MYKKIKIFIVFFSLILLITGCSNDLPGTDSNIEETEMISGTIIGSVDSANIPLSNRQSLINNTVVTTDDNGAFTISSNSTSNSIQNVSSLSNSNEITIETQGFNEYSDSNWYEGKEARLIPYLVVVEVNYQTPATYQHAFKYLLSNSYNNTDYPNDNMTFYHQESNLTYELRYRETDWGYKDFANKKEDWSTIENIATGEWLYEGTIEGNEVIGQFIVDMPEELTQANPKITSYELYESVIRVYYDINHTVDKAYIRTDDTFYEIPDPNSSADHIDIPYEDLNIDKKTSESINIYIQPVNVNNLQFGYQIKSEAVTIENINENIKDTYTATITVVDENNLGIEGAEITLNGEIKNTDINGTASFDNLVDDNYSYTVSTEGYVDIEGSVQINGSDENLKVEQLSIEKVVNINITNAMQTIEDEEPEGFRNYASNDFEYISGSETISLEEYISNLRDGIDSGNTIEVFEVIDRSIISSSLDEVIIEGTLDMVGTDLEGNSYTNSKHTEIVVRNIDGAWLITKMTELEI